jgi:hypothetical protein
MTAYGRDSIRPVTALIHEPGGISKAETLLSFSQQL